MGFPAILADIILPTDKIMKCVFFLPRAHRELPCACSSLHLVFSCSGAVLGKAERKEGEERFFPHKEGRGKQVFQLR